MTSGQGKLSSLSAAAGTHRRISSGCELGTVVEQPKMPKVSTPEPAELDEVAPMKQISEIDEVDAGPLGTPPKRPKHQSTDDVIHRLQAKLEREVLLRQRSETPASSEDSDSSNESEWDKERHDSCEPNVSGSRRPSIAAAQDQAPEGYSVPLPSPFFMSRENTPHASSPASSFFGPSPYGGSAADSTANSPCRGDSPRRWSAASSNAPTPYEYGGDTPRTPRSPRNGGFCIPLSEQALSEGNPKLSLERDFRSGETIGSGSFGRVFSARHRGSGQIIAVKELLLEGTSDAARADRADARLARELQLCEQLRHERVVSYFGHEYAAAGSASSQRIFIFLEYCTGGSVASHLRTYGPLEEPLMAKYAQQLLEGLTYLHSLTPPVVHRDLKCANLLLTHDANIKIADFGCSKWLWERDESHPEDLQHSMVGSVFWTAPEVLQGGAGLTVSSDYWSFGCCVLEMATAKHPWSEHQFDNIFAACRLIICSEMLPDVPVDLPSAIQDIIFACLRRTASERPSASELLAFPLLSSEAA